MEILLFCRSKTQLLLTNASHPCFVGTELPSGTHPPFLVSHKHNALFLSFSLPQPRLERTKSNQCSWFKFAAQQGLYFCWHSSRAITAEGARDTRLADLNRTCNSCFCHILSTVRDICTSLQLIFVGRLDMKVSWKYMTGFFPLCCAFCGPVLNKAG